MKIEKGTDEYKKRTEEVKNAISIIADYCKDISCRDCPFRYETSVYAYCRLEEEPMCPSMWEDKYFKEDNK